MVYNYEILCTIFFITGGLRMIAVIDYDAGNIASVSKAFMYLGEKIVVTRDSNEILSADKVVLPGVGAYADCMNKLHHYQLVDTITKVVEKKTPFLGICLGLQLLFEDSEEGGHIEGLSLLPGRIVRIPDTCSLKIPHIGWNSIQIRPDSKLFAGIGNDAYVYFVHSYYLKAREESIVSATCEYGTLIHAAVERDNVYACQFHPEKSGEVGLQILKNFATL